MAGRIIEHKPKPHACEPGVIGYTRRGSPIHYSNKPGDGDIWQCDDCGDYWRAMWLLDGSFRWVRWPRDTSQVDP